MKVDSLEPVPLSWALVEGVPGVSGGCARLEHENRTGRTHQWLQKQISLKEGGRVQVDVSFDVALLGTLGLQKRSLVAVSALGAWESGQIDSYFTYLGSIGTLEDQPGATQTFSYSADVSIPPEGWVWVTVGFASGWETTQMICVDNIRIVITKS